MKKPIALVFSDLHLNMWAKFNDNNERTLNGFRVLFDLAKVSDKLGNIPALFCGDFFHKPESMDSDLALITKAWLNRLFEDYPKFNIICINGNHDIKRINSLDKPSLGWLDLLASKNFKVLHPSEYKFIGEDKYVVHGIPYIDHNIGLSKYLQELHLDNRFKHILLLHTDYPGAKDTDGRPIDSVENLNVNVLNKFDLTLCGHIHKPQRLGKKVYMVGAPIQQRRTDRDCEMGYWILYDDLSMKFKSLNEYPKFIDVNTPEEVKEDGNYYTVLPQKASIVENTKHKITKQLSKKKLAHRYMKAKGIKDKTKEELLIKILNRAENPC